MVSHSSSASLSSFQFSHPSSSSSSSLSSPLSSPDSGQTSFAAPGSTISSPSSTHALVPFLWEDKPGVVKKAMQSSEGGGHNHRSSREVSLSDQGRPQVHKLTSRSDSCGSSSKRMSRTFPASKSKARGESVPHLRPPPRLSQPNLHEYMQGENNEAYNHHRQLETSAALKAKVMSSFSIYQRRHRRATSLEDDPFWMAMVACTDDKGKDSCLRFSGNRDKAHADSRRTNSWFIRREQGHSIHFEECIPRRASSSEKNQASCHRRNSSNEGVRDVTKRDGQHDRTDASGRATHLASKAFKALSIAKSELHGQCKVLLQRQSAPVDVSCSTSRSKKPSFPWTRKVPDVLVCKSHPPGNIPP